MPTALGVLRSEGLDGHETVYPEKALHKEVKTRHASSMNAIVVLTGCNNIQEVENLENSVNVGPAWGLRHPTRILLYVNWERNRF